MKYLFYSVVAICITVLLGLLIVKVDAFTLLAIVVAICGFTFVGYIFKRVFDFLGR